MTSPAHRTHLDPDQVRRSEARLVLGLIALVFLAGTALYVGWWNV